MPVDPNDPLSRPQPDPRTDVPEAVQLVSALGRFVSLLALSPSHYRAYENPATREATMEAAGLSDDQKAALESNDWQRIFALMGPGDRGDGRRDPDPDDGGP